MGYNPQFRLNPRQLALIEDSLRAEKFRMAENLRTKEGASGDAGAELNRQAVREISELLAHLHHQKSWYRPKDQAVPLG